MNSRTPSREDARNGLHFLDRLRDVKACADCGLGTEGTAVVLGLPQARVARLLASLKFGGGSPEPEPEEIILHAYVDRADRSELLEQLKAYPYTFGECAPWPHDGYLPGTWDQVVSAMYQDLLSWDEFDQLRAAVGR